MPAQTPQWPDWQAQQEWDRATRAEEEIRRAAEEARRNEEQQVLQRDRLESLESLARFPSPEDREAQRQAELRTAEKNYREMTEAAKDLVAFSQKITREIDADSNDMHSVSKSFVKDLERLEKLAKKVRGRGKRLPRK